MPVFGRGKITRKITDKRKPGTTITKSLFGKEKKIHKQHMPWIFENSSLFVCSHSLNFKISDWVKKRFSKTNKPVVVLDWGCGKGKAITELARKNKNLSCYGFGKDSYSSWIKNPHVKFIQNTSKSMLRYFKNGSIDMIFSNFGLFHLNTGFFDYAVKISKKLKKGGILVSQVPSVSYFDRTRFFAKYKDARKKAGSRIKTKEKIVIPSKGIDIEINWLSNLIKIKKLT